MQSWQKAMETYSEQSREAFRFWVSFWPVAPVFGVPWRFEEMARGAGLPGLEGLSDLPGMPGMPGMGQSDRTRRKAAEAVESIFRAPPVAKPVEDAKLASYPKRTEEAIEQTLEPAPETHRTEPAAAEKAAEGPAVDAQPLKADAVDPTPEARAAAEPEPAVETPAVATATEAKADAPTPELDLEPTNGTASASRPKGLLKSAPKTVDDLKLIKGIGPGLEKQLNGLGIFRFAQIAGFDTQDLAWVDAQLTSIKGRCFRDDWIGQAKALAG